MNKGKILENTCIFLTALFAVGLFRMFVIEPYWIPSGSMRPTLEVKDRVFAAKFLYRIPNVEPQRGDIIVFKYPLDTTRDFTKRIIGLPGEKIEIIKGVVYVDKESLPEPYVVNKDEYNMEEIQIPEQNYFCMGDNRPNSQDSRFWGFVHKDLIKGPIILRYWPLKKASVL